MEKRGSSLLLLCVPLLQGLGGFRVLGAFLFSWLGELNHSLRAFREPGPWPGVWDKARTAEGGHGACCSSRIEGMGLLSTLCPITPFLGATGLGAMETVVPTAAGVCRLWSLVPSSQGLAPKLLTLPEGMASWRFHILRRLGFQQPHRRGWGTQIPLERAWIAALLNSLSCRGARGISHYSTPCKSFANCFIAIICEDKGKGLIN